MIRWMMAGLLLTGCSAALPPDALELSLSVHDLMPSRHVVGHGQQVELTVSSAGDAEVHLHGFDLTAKPGRGRPVVLRFLADRTGTFEIGLHPSHRLLGNLVVR